MFLQRVDLTVEVDRGKKPALFPRIRKKGID